MFREPRTLLKLTWRTLQNRISYHVKLNYFQRRILKKQVAKENKTAHESTHEWQSIIFWNETVSSKSYIYLLLKSRSINHFETQRFRKEVGSSLCNHLHVWWYVMFAKCFWSYCCPCTAYANESCVHGSCTESGKIATHRTRQIEQETWPELKLSEQFDLEYIYGIWRYWKCLLKPLEITRKPDTHKQTYFCSWIFELR